MALSKLGDDRSGPSPWRHAASWLGAVSDASVELWEDATGFLAGSMPSGVAVAALGSCQRIKPFREVDEACSSSASAWAPGPDVAGEGRRLPERLAVLLRAGRFGKAPQAGAGGAEKRLSLLGCLPEGLSEIAQDLEIGDSHAALMLPITLSVLSGPSTSVVWICGFSVPIKVMYGSVAALMAIGTWSMSGREPSEANRTMQTRCALALAASGLQHLLLAFMGHVPVPAPLADYVFRPEVVAHFLQELAVGPLLILNLGHLVGLGPRKMGGLVSCNLVTTASAIAAAAAQDHLHSMGWLAVSFATVGGSAYMVSSLPNQAQAPCFSTLSKKRCQIAGDLLVFSWTLHPLIQLLGVLGALSLPQTLHMFAVVDVVAKIGTCHLLLRSSVAMRTSAQHFEAERQIANSVGGSGASGSGAGRGQAQSAYARGTVEPCSEPAPRSER